MRHRRFQSTRPYGARRRAEDQHADDRGFNPRARTGRDDARVEQIRSHQSFNPRARTGRDVLHRSRTVDIELEQVSIHAPVRGATDSINYLYHYASKQPSNANVSISYPLIVRTTLNNSTFASVSYAANPPGFHVHSMLALQD